MENKRVTIEYKNDSLPINIENVLKNSMGKILEEIESIKKPNIKETIDSRIGYLLNIISSYIIQEALNECDMETEYHLSQPTSLHKYNKENHGYKEDINGNDR